MNWDIIKGNWDKLSGEARKKWCKLTGDDWVVIGGEKDKLLGRLQERYGWSKDQAEKDVHQHFQFIPERADPNVPQ